MADNNKEAAKRVMSEVEDYLGDVPTLGDIAQVRRGTLKDKDRPVAECWACGRFAKGALIHESPGTAKCCKDCDAYRGNTRKEIGNYEP